MPDDAAPNMRREAGKGVEQLYYALSEKLYARLGPDVDPSTEQGRAQVEAAW